MSRRTTASGRRPRRKAGNSIGPPEEVIEIQRKAGGLRRLTTSSGRSYLLLGTDLGSMPLEKGSVIGPGDIAMLEGEGARKAGMALALGLLARRERSVFEVRSALRDEGLENLEVIDYIVDTLQSKGYLDDRRFASELAGWLVSSRSAGPGMVRHRLERAGVPRDVIEEEIGRVFAEGRDRGMAMRAAAARLRTMRGLDRRRAAGRIRGYLARRGYDAGLVSDITYRVMNGELTGDDDER